MNAFFKSQFNQRSLVWMCCNKSLNTKMNRLHGQCLRISYNDKETNFNELISKDGSVSIYHQNLQKFAGEIFDFSRALRPEIVNELLQFREPILYELRRRSQFQIPFVHLVFSGTESLKFLGSKIWALVPNEMKQSESLKKSRNAIKQWNPTSCLFLQTMQKIYSQDWVSLIKNTFKEWPRFSPFCQFEVTSQLLCKL